MNPRVKIQGEQTVSQAADEACIGLGGLTDAASKAIDIAKGFVAYEVLTQVAEWANRCVTAFAEQEKATLTLTAATQSSLYITSEGSAQLLEYAGSMSKVTGESEETIESMETFLVAAGRNKHR